ncbi:glycosyltransferase [Hoeflea sp.]|uniref:glycosyltransferase n=1 Tax=Hoeflea sp. TaxID=1940281 RepID=UPI003B02A8BC
MFELLFAGNEGRPGEAVAEITIAEVDRNRFDLAGKDGISNKGLQEKDLPKYVMDAIIAAFCADISDAVCLHAGIVDWRGKSILLAGGPGSGKSLLAGWMALNGCGYFTDELVALNKPDVGPAALRCPLILRDSAFDTLVTSAGSANTELNPLALGRSVLINPSARAGPEQPAAISAILFPAYETGVAAGLTSLSSSEASMRLFANSLNSALLDDGGLGTLTGLAQQAPSVALRFHNPFELADRLDDLLAEMTNPLSGAAGWHRLHSLFLPDNSVPAPAATPEPPRPVNAPTARGKPVPLTIGMATYDDYDGVYFTIQSLRLNNPDLLSQIEFLVIDNNPESSIGDALKALEKLAPNFRYVPCADRFGTAVRDLVFAEAAGEFVMCVDCHVLLQPGALAGLFAYMREHPDSADLLQGPMISENLQEEATHFELIWRDGMYGTWAKRSFDPDQNEEPFEIPAQGLGLFVSRRETWPGFNLKFRGFGGEEGYIHEKFRQRGNKVLCLPFLRWLHRFSRPAGVQYNLSWEDRIRNYRIGFRELGLDEGPIGEHFSDRLGKENYKRITQKIDAELENPFNYFDATWWINLDSQAERRKAMQDRVAKLGIERLSNRFSAIETPQNHHVGCALSHRAIIEDAKRRGAKNVLVLEDDALFRHDCIRQLSAMVRELDAIEWDLFFLGGRVWGDAGERLSDNSLLRAVKKLTSAQAVAVNGSMFERILDELPHTEEAMASWIECNHAIDQYYAKLEIQKLVADPMISVQIEHFEPGNQLRRDDFDL